MIRAPVIAPPTQALEVSEYPPDLEDGAALLRVTYSEVCGTGVYRQEPRLAQTPYPLIPLQANVGAVKHVKDDARDVHSEPIRVADRNAAEQIVLGHVEHRSITASTHRGA